MASKVSIANRALVKLGDEPILLLEDDSKRARTIKSMFDEVRRAEIRRHRWKFAIKREELVALAEAPKFGYRYQFPLPNDYLGLVQVGEFYLRSRMQAPWSVEGGRILTNMPAPLRIRYQCDVDNPGLFDPLFVEVLACKLAMEACEAINQSSTKYQSCAEAYQFAVSEATRQDAIENPPDELPQGSWLDSRGYGDGTYSADVGSWQSYTSGV